MRRVLLDANLLIAALDDAGTSSPEKKEQAKRMLAELLTDEDVVLAITPLIRYEVLRGVPWQDEERFNTLKNSLDSFAELMVTREVSELAADVFRFDRSANSNAGRNIDKRKFDVFHLTSAQSHGLEIASEDSDIDSLNELFAQYQAETSILEV